jgi:hypothetical protein
MKRLLPLISAIGLALVIVPACLYLAGMVEKPQMKLLMLIGTALWFLTAPFWMGRDRA